MNEAELEHLVDVITREVLRAAEQGSVPVPAHCVECENGRCAITCPDVAQQFLDAGAVRLSLPPGVSHIDTDIAQLIDHTLLKPEATQEQIRQLCVEARTFGFASVCVNPFWVPYCTEMLADTPSGRVAVCTVVGFPLGANRPSIKAAETDDACRNGAAEIDMVINVGALKGDEFEVVADDIAGVVTTAHRHDAIVKVIIEAALLTDEEKVEACTIAAGAGAEYVKTSTGFGPGGATIHDVALMRRVVGPELGVKAAGGIRTYEDAAQMIDAGATRIGASAGVAIVRGSDGS